MVSPGAIALAAIVSIAALLLVLRSTNGPSTAFAVAGDVAVLEIREKRKKS
jgi:hypothetical protein